MACYKATSRPRLCSAGRIRNSLDARTDSPAANLEEILVEGSPLGGARPKATVRDNEQRLWLARLACQKDTLVVPVIETATLRLATEAGLTLPPVKAIRLGARTVMLSRRFDRYWAKPGDDAHLPEDLRSQAPAAGLVEKRLGFVSSLTPVASDEVESPDKSYRDLAQAIRRCCHESVIRENSRELFGRLVFNIFVSNDDNHLRNHGCIWDVRLPGWRLSPIRPPAPLADLLLKPLPISIVLPRGLSGCAIAPDRVNLDAQHTSLIAQNF